MGDVAILVSGQLPAGLKNGPDGFEANVDFSQSSLSIFGNSDAFRHRNGEDV